MSDDSDSSGPKRNGHKVNGHHLPDLSRIFGMGRGRATVAAQTEPLANAEELPFDLEAVEAALTPVQTEIPEDAFTAGVLGTQRQGGGIVIGSGGLILTMGYLVAEAESAAVLNSDGDPIEADPVAYDYESGFGLLRAVEPLGRPAMEFGTARDLSVGSTIIAACGGAETIAQTIVSRRRFSGYWEYRIDDALFTMPAHPNWGGAAMVGMDGLLYGVGSLYVEDAIEGEEKSVGNMFVPIDLLEPILDDLLLEGHRSDPPRPWLGLYAGEKSGHLVIMGVAPKGPAAHAGLQQGDIVLRVNLVAIGSLDDFYDQLWDAGPAGATLQLTLMRGDRVFEMKVATADRADFLLPTGLATGRGGR